MQSIAIVKSIEFFSKYSFFKAINIRSLFLSSLICSILFKSTIIEIFFFGKAFLSLLNEI